MDNNTIQKTENDNINSQNGQVDYFSQNGNNQSKIEPIQAGGQVFSDPNIQIPEALNGYEIVGLPNGAVKNKRPNILSAIAISVLVTLSIAAVMYLISGKNNIASNSSNLVPALILMLFPIIGSSIGLNMIQSERKNKERCTQLVIGKCTEVSTRMNTDLDGDRNIMYTPTYGYEANGQNYTIISGDSYGGMIRPTVGSNRQILFNPSDPSDAFIPKSLAQIIMMIAICGSFIVCGLGALFVFINK